MTANGGHRLVALDGLRGIAALMVFVHHVQLPGLHPQLIGMDAGVLIFFALSGYLLYAPFVKARDGARPVDLGSYAIRRVLRIMPAYLVGSVAIAALFYPDTLRDPLGILTMAHTPVIVAWTLRLEVVFYATLPLIAAVVGMIPAARRPAALMVVGACSVLATVAIMTVAIAITGSIDSTALETFASFLWAFMPGMIVAELERRGRLAGAIRWPVAAVGIGLIALSVAVDPPASLDLAAGVGAGLVIAYLVARPTISPALARPAVVAGALSYSFYLWHEAIVTAVDRPATWIGAAIALTLSLLVAAVAYVLVERPGIELGRRLSQSRRARMPDDWGIQPSGPLVP